MGVNTIIIGNIICLAGSAVMVAVGFLKGRKKILAGQCLQYLILGGGNLVLGGISGAIADGVSIVRNLLSLKIQFNWILKVIFIGIQVALTAIFNNAGFVGWLPTLAACIFTWCVDTKNEILLKLLIILAQVMWAVYDLYFKNFSTMAFDIATVISNLAGIFMILKAKKQKSESMQE